MDKITHYSNGVRLITSEMPHMASVSMGIWVGVGGRHEEKKLNGISHLLEHIAFKDTEKRKTYEIYRDIEGIGGTLNAFTAEECTCYTAKVPALHTGVAFDVLSDIYFNQKIDTDELQKEINVIKEEICMYQDMPSQHVQDVLLSILWPEHSLGRPLIGTLDTLKNIDRATLHSYKNSMYTLDNIVISAVGNVTHSYLENLVTEYFSQKNDKEKPCFLPAEISQTKPCIKITKKNVEQCYVSIGIRALARTDPEIYALKLLSVILGENASSRLFQVIREQHGLAYDIQTSIEKFVDTGVLIINVGTDINKLIKCIRLIINELHKLRSDLIDKQELSRAKEYCFGQIAMNREKTFDYMLWIGESLLTTGTVDSFDEIMRKINYVTEVDIANLAKRLFVDASLNLSVVGPSPDKENITDCFHF